MSGICGIWHRDGRPVEAAELAAMSQAMRHRGPDGERRWLNRNAGLAFQAMHVTPEATSAPQPLVARGGAVVLFDGRLDNRTELRDGLRGAVTVDAADCELVAAAYDAFGEELFSRLLGDFAIAIFDPATRTLLLARDRMGTRPLYYCVAGETLLMGSEIKAILAHPAAPLRPNDDALADYLMPGDAQCHDISFFDGIFPVVPGELVAVTPHGLRRKKFWDFDPSRQIRYARAGEYAEHLREVVVRAVRRRARSSHPVAVMVSGGLDSSGIYCVLRQLQETGNAPPMVGLNLVYPGFEEANEERYIGDLERAAGREIVRLPAPSGFMDAPEQAVWHAEAPPTPMGYRMPQCIAAGARRHNARVVLNGTFGDQVLGSPYYLVDLATGLRWHTLFRHLQNVQRWAMDVRAGYFRQFALAATARAITPRWMYPMIRMLRELSPNHPKRPRWFAPGFRARSARRARWQAPLSGDFASHHARAQFQNTVWPIYMRALELGNKAMAAGGVEESSPFWDRDLVEFLMAVPGEVVNLDGIPKGLYREAMRGILPESIRLRRDKGDFTRFVNSEARSELGAIRESLGRNCLGVTMGYLDPAALAGALDPDHPQYADRSTSDPARRAAALIGLELWLEVFFGRSRSEVAQPPQAAALSLAE